MSTSENTVTNQQATDAGQAPAAAPGTFCWWQLGTTDTDGAKNFYGGLFGWDVIDMPVPDGVHTTFRIDGRDVCAMYELGAELVSQGVPPHWLSYISVTNVDESAGRVTANGGTVVMPPFDVMELGRMAVARDPQGAAFAMWEPRAHTGAAHINKLGSVCWNELATTDADAARTFYSAVFGWDCQKQQINNVDYTMIAVNGGNEGGMMQMTEQWAGIPPHWMSYFWVSDCDASAAKVKELGGKVVVEPFDVPAAGRMAVIQDPQGAAFSIIQVTDMNQ